MSWLHSLPLWLQWTLMAPLLLLGNGVIWVVVLAVNEVFPPLPNVPWPEWLDGRRKTSWLLGCLDTVFSLMVLALMLDALVAAFFVPTLFYRFVLGWSWWDSTVPGVFTTIGLIVVWYIVLCWRWERGGREKAEREIEAANESRKRCGSMADFP